MITIEQLQRRIKAAEDLQSIVRTMKALAAANINQYERAVEALDDYNRTIDLGFQIAWKRDPLGWNRGDSPSKTVAIVFGSSQGMCGQFNEAIVSRVNEMSRESQSDSPWLILAVGTRAESQLIENGWSIEQSYDIPSSVSDITDLVQSMLPKIERLSSSHNIDRLLVFFNRRASASSFHSHHLQLLPIDPQRRRRWQEEPWRSNSLPLMATDRRQLISRLTRQYLFVSLFTACAQSQASENASRIAAMQAAEKNIEQRLDDLRGTFNQLRQSAITEELLDVVSGFEALTGESD